MWRLTLKISLEVTRKDIAESNNNPRLHMEILKNHTLQMRTRSHMKSIATIFIKWIREKKKILSISTRNTLNTCMLSMIQPRKFKCYNLKTKISKRKCKTWQFQESGLITHKLIRILKMIDLLHTSLADQLSSLKMKTVR